MFEEYFEQIKEAAKEKYPYEFCGIITSSGFEICNNISSSPRDSFILDPADIEGKSLLSVVHSHIIKPETPAYRSGYRPDCPSYSDMQQQIASNIPWIITLTNGQDSSEPFVFGDGKELTAELIGRPFRYGVRDCYTAIRAWYWQTKKVILSEYPRSVEFWNDQTPGYLELYENEGFYRIGFDEIQIGSLLLFQIAAPVPNHGAVYIGKGKMYHHPAPGPAFGLRAASTLSRIEAVGRWQECLTHCLGRD